MSLPIYVLPSTHYDDKLMESFIDQLSLHVELDKELSPTLSPLHIVIFRPQGRPNDEFNAVVLRFLDKCNLSCRNIILFTAFAMSQRYGCGFTPDCASRFKYIDKLLITSGHLDTQVNKCTFKRLGDVLGTEYGFKQKSDDQPQLQRYMGSVHLCGGQELETTTYHFQGNHANSKEDINTSTASHTNSHEDNGTSTASHANSEEDNGTFPGSKANRQEDNGTSTASHANSKEDNGISTGSKTNSKEDNGTSTASHANSQEDNGTSTARHVNSQEDNGTSTTSHANSQEDNATFPGSKANSQEDNDTFPGSKAISQEDNGTSTGNHPNSQGDNGTSTARHAKGQEDNGIFPGSKANSQEDNDTSTARHVNNQEDNGTSSGNYANSQEVNGTFPGSKAISQEDNGTSTASHANSQEDNSTSTGRKANSQEDIGTSTARHAYSQEDNGTYPGSKANSEEDNGTSTARHANSTGDNGTSTGNHASSQEDNGTFPGSIAIRQENNGTSTASKDNSKENNGNSTESKAISQEDHDSCTGSVANSQDDECNTADANYPVDNGNPPESDANSQLDKGYSSGGEANSLVDNSSSTGSNAIIQGITESRCNLYLEEINMLRSIQEGIYKETTVLQGNVETKFKLPQGKLFRILDEVLQNLNQEQESAVTSEIQGKSPTLLGDDMARKIEDQLEMDKGSLNKIIQALLKESGSNSCCPPHSGPGCDQNLDKLRTILEEMKTKTTDLQRAVEKKCKLPQGILLDILDEVLKCQQNQAPKAAGMSEIWGRSPPLLGDDMASRIENQLVLKTGSLHEIIDAVLKIHSPLYFKPKKKKGWKWLFWKSDDAST